MSSANLARVVIVAVILAGLIFCLPMADLIAGTKIFGMDLEVL